MVSTGYKEYKSKRLCLSVLPMHLKEELLSTETISHSSLTLDTSIEATSKLQPYSLAPPQRHARFPFIASPLDIFLPPTMSSKSYAAAEPSNAQAALLATVMRMRRQALTATTASKLPRGNSTHMSLRISSHKHKERHSPYPTSSTARHAKRTYRRQERASPPDLKKRPDTLSSASSRPPTTPPQQSASPSIFSEPSVVGRATTSHDPMMLTPMHLTMDMSRALKRHYEYEIYDAGLKDSNDCNLLDEAKQEKVFQEMLASYINSDA
ncbi:hypothetical protein EW145_g1991 [Phellinidium pouzarii]|uniref:Uncharacterized protein n=1 Tax=Phellinidium pouzarii TaxID=167371 RepID=A0A4S4LEE4_9AGAM|nr:hypothetical protein EW145_g1991 [Phellinidium pouzarii]